MFRMMMRHGRRVGRSGALLAFVSGGFAGLASAEAAPAPQPPAPRAAWTLMVFMNGDNNLEGYAIRDFREMAEIGSSADVNVVVQMDRIGKYASPRFDEPTWTDTKRFLIKFGTKPTPDEALVSLGEVNMGAPGALQEFVEWARKNYPADRYALVVWDHGKGYRAIDEKPPEESMPFRSSTSAPHRSISDDDTNKDHLYNVEVVTALEKALKGDKLDILGFDACLMAMVETAYAMRTTADYMVGSEELEPSDGWNYADVLTRLAANPRMDGRELARILVRSYRDEYTDGPFGANPTTTQSAIDLTRIEDLASGVSALADALSKGLSTHADAILQARRDCAEYAPGADRNKPETILFHHVDLGRFASQLVTRVQDAAIVDAAKHVRDRLQTVVIENYAGVARQEKFGSTGLAIYFPVDRKAYRNDKFEQGGYKKGNTFFPVAFVQAHTWSDYLHRYFDRFQSVRGD